MEVVSGYKPTPDLEEHSGSLGSVEATSGWLGGLFDWRIPPRVPGDPTIKPTVIEPDYLRPAVS
jgi:hypothetical protein